MNDSLADRCEYSVNVWCSVHHTYFQLLRSASRISSSSLSTAWCSDAGSCAFAPGRNICTKIPNSTVPPVSRCTHGALLQRVVPNDRLSDSPSEVKRPMERRSPPTERVIRLL